MNGSKIKRFIAKLKFLWALYDHYPEDMNNRLTHITEVDHAVQVLRRQHESLRGLVVELKEEFSSQMAIGYDIHPMSNSWVICIGHHKNHDYVRAFPVEDKDFGYLVELALRMNHEYPRARFYYDHPYGVSVERVVKDYKNKG